MKKTIVIVVLLISLLVSFYVIFEIKKMQPGIPEVPVVVPDAELEAAFEQSSQHSALADIAELSCFPTRRYDCSLEGGCVVGTPKTYYFIDHGTDVGTYFRCDAKGCDQYPVNVKVSGSFTQFLPFLGQAMLFKVANNKDPLVKSGEFLDIVTIGTTAVVSSGVCQFSN